MLNYKQILLPMIFSTFLSYSTEKTGSPSAKSKYSPCLHCFPYLLPALPPFHSAFLGAPTGLILAHAHFPPFSLSAGEFGLQNSQVALFKSAVHLSLLRGDVLRDGQVSVGDGRFAPPRKTNQILQRLLFRPQFISTTTARVRSRFRG